MPEAIYVVHAKDVDPDDLTELETSLEFMDEGALKLLLTDMIKKLESGTDVLLCAVEDFPHGVG
jgi:hypothetical protein